MNESCENDTSNFELWRENRLSLRYIAARDDRMFFATRAEMWSNNVYTLVDMYEPQRSHVTRRILSNSCLNDDLRLLQTHRLCWKKSLPKCFKATGKKYLQQVLSNPY